MSTHYRVKCIIMRSVQSITRFDYHAEVCLPDDVQKCLRIQKATGEVWIGLEQDINDTAISE